MSQDRSGRERRGQEAPEAEAFDADQAMTQQRLDVARKRKVVQRKAERAAGASPVRIPDGGAPLGGDVRSRMEGHLGADLSSVRVNSSGASAEAANALGARAFTDGNDVHFGAGQFAPGTREGDRLIAHELTHVVQGQKSGIQRKKAEAGDEESEHEAGGLEVSEPGDTAELEADAVADHITDHEHAPGGGKPQPGQAKPAVSARLSGVGRKIYRNATGTITDKNHVGPGPAATAAGEFNIAGGSNAENATFEGDAAAFETKLGALAFGRAQGIGASVVGKVKAYLQTKLAPGITNLAQIETEIAKMMSTLVAGSRLGVDKGFAGNVQPEDVQQIMLGKAQLDDLNAQVAAARGDVEKLKNLPEPPNVREQMTLIYHFATNMLNSEILDAARSKPLLDKLVADGQLSKDAVELRVKFAADQAAKRKDAGGEQLGKNGDGSNAWDVIGMVPQDPKKHGEVKPDADASGETQQAAGDATAVGGQWSARDNRQKVEKEDQKDKPTDQQKPVTPANDPNRKAGDVAAEGTGLSGREAKMQALTGPENPVKWNEGARMWVINEKDKWVKAMRQLSLPLAAGPSGTTNVLMNANAILGGTEPVNMRAAAIGYLLPIHAHSLVEVCAAAAAHGVGFTAGKKIYRELPPFGPDELLATCGRQGPLSGKKLFPDEADVAPQAAAPPAAAPSAPGAPGAAPAAAPAGSAPAAPGGAPAAGGPAPASPVAGPAPTTPPKPPTG